MKKLLALFFVLCLVFTLGSAAATQAQQPDGETPPQDQPDTEPGEEPEVLTLSALGFEDFREPSAKCTIMNDEYGWLFISKDEWGENANEGERNALTFMTKEHDTMIVVFYYVETQSYVISVENGEQQTKYIYIPAEDRYTDEYGGDDMTQALEVTTKAFLAPGEEADALGVAWGKLDYFITDILGTTADELFVLDYD